MLLSGQVLHRLIEAIHLFWNLQKTLPLLGLFNEHISMQDVGHNMLHLHLHLSLLPMTTMLS